MPLSSHLLALIPLIALAASASAPAWSYTGDGETKPPADWGEVAAPCGGESQSPINIIPGEAEYDDDLAPFVFTNYEAENPAAYFATNAHAPKVTFNTSDVMPSVTGAGLVGTYNFVQLHIHFGKSSAEGSEHTMNGMHYPAELHLVHMNAKYGSFDEAQDKSDALAVVGIMIDEGEEDNAHFAGLISALPDITEDGSTIEMTQKFPLSATLPKDDQDVYYRYHGSLTTPDCFEIVTWSVMKEPIYFSASQLDAMRSQLLVGGAGSDSLLFNFRPTQPLNGREVTTSMRPMNDDDEGGASGLAFSCITMATMLLSALFLM